MSGFLAMRDTLRDFFRKYDEITTPVLRFIASIIMFMSVNAMFGYSDLFDKGIVIFLLALICALVSNTVAVLVAGLVVFVNAMAVSKDVGVLFLIFFVLMYCMYMRMFPKCSYVLALVPILCMMHLYYAVPLIVVILAGAPGMVPTAFGVVLYYFSEYVRDAKDMQETATEEENFQAYSYIVEQLTKNKTMLVGMIIFAVVILITYIIYRLPIDYAWYISVAVGALCNIMFFLICGAATDIDVSAGSVILGTLLGAIFALVVQVCKSILDYSRKEIVQFEDDEYYYYVKAIPKYSMSAKKKNVRRMTSNDAAKPQQQKSGSAGSREKQKAADNTVQSRAAERMADIPSQRGTTNILATTRRND